MHKHYDYLQSQLKEKVFTKVIKMQSWMNDLGFENKLSN